MAAKPLVMAANNPETACILEREFPGRLGTLLAPGRWKDPGGVPYVLDNGRFSVWSRGEKWSEKKFLELLDTAADYEYPPRWIVVPDVVGKGQETLNEWYKWRERLLSYGWPLAFAVQDGITLDVVRTLDPQPEVIFIGGTDDWVWKYARVWCENFPRCHIGKVSTVKRLWKVEELGAESSDSTVWRIGVGQHADKLRKYLEDSEAGRVRKREYGFFGTRDPWEIVKEKEMSVQKQVVTDRYAIYQGDCCEVMSELPGDSVGFSVFSPPFADLFAYSDSDADMGNSRSYEEFFDHFGFLVRELQRVMIPGRIVAVHCMDLPTFKVRGGEMGLRDFPGDIVRLFERNDFVFTSRHCIWKDPLVAATRTKAIGLAHKQIVKDSSVCRMGIPDYVLAFRKRGDNPKLIAHPQGLVEYHGAKAVPHHLDRFIGWNGEQKKNKRSHWIWQRYASPVWDDIRQGKVLPYVKARDKDDERHICPLQTDVVYRCLTLWSAEDDIVLSPFAGVGTEPFCAVKMGRKGIGIELKGSYFNQMKRNLESLSRKSVVETFA